MEQTVLAFIALFGLIFGSFFNVLIFRLNSEESWVPKFWQGRSVCPKCKRPIAWFDNIPLVSFLLLSGKCRRCKDRISWQYPLVELTTCFVTATIGAFFLSHSPIFDQGSQVLAINMKVFWESVFYLIIGYVFIVIFFSDLIYGLIPDEAVGFGIVATIAFRFWNGALNESLLVGSGAALAFFVIVLVTKFRGMGFGDVKLAFLLGFVLGWPAAVVGFWMAFILGGISAISLIALKRVKISATIALGPYLIVGATVSALWSTKLLHLLFGF